MVLGRLDAGRFGEEFFLRRAVERQDRDGRDAGVGREKCPDVQHGAERDVTEIRRCTVILDDAEGQHGERVGWVIVESARRLHTDAATAVRSVHEDELPSIRIRLLQGRKLPHLRPERLGLRFRSGGGLLGSGRGRRRRDEHGEEQNGEPAPAERGHTSSTPLLSPKRSISTPIFWAMSSSRLLIRASGFTGRRRILKCSLKLSSR